MNTIIYDNYIVDIYTDNDIVNNAYNKFKSDILKTPLNDIAAISNNIYDVLTRLSNIELNSLFISLTGYGGIFIRFSNKMGNEFKLEKFYDLKEDNSGDFESILHVYKNSKKQDSFYGSLDEMFEIIGSLSNVFKKSYAVINASEKVDIAQILPLYMPIYNQEKYIPQAAFSAVKQESHHPQQFATC